MAERIHQCKGIKAMTYEEHIVPATSIGSILLGMSVDELNKAVGKFVIRTEHPDAIVLVRKPYTVWVSRASQRVTQIGVSLGYLGTFLGSIGIGSTLPFVESKAGPVYEELDTYQLARYPGIAFELEDDPVDGEWSEKTAPVCDIYVFDPHEVD